MRGIGKGSFGQALFKFVKSTQTRHFLLFFFTTTVLTNHSGWKTSLIAPACLSYVTLFLTASECSLDVHRGGYCLGVTDGLTFKWWQMKVGSTLGASYAFHANMSTFFFNNSTNFCLSWGGSWDLTWKNFSWSSPTVTFSRFSHSAPLVDSLLVDVEVFDCYKFISEQAEDLTFSLCNMAATMHYVAINWLPTISLTWPWDGGFTFWWKVEETAPKAWTQGLAIIVVYGEYESTIIKSTSIISKSVCIGNLIWHLGMTVFPLKLTRGES